VRAPSVGLFTYSTLPRGSVVHAACLADALHDAGWDVTLYALDKDRRGLFRACRAPVRLIPAAPGPATTAELVRLRAREIADYLTSRGAAHDVYHAEDCLTANGLLEVQSRGCRLDVVRTVHHVESFEDPYLARCQARSIREAALCFAVSAAAKRDVMRSFGVRALRITNGVSVERFARPDPARVRAWTERLGLRADGGPVLLAVGGVEERKNTVATLRAFARVRGEHAGARLIVLGGATVLDHGAYRASFERELLALPPSTRDAVIETGTVAEDDVPAIFSIASALVFPSLHEGFGLAALEGLAAGLPVVASKRPPLTEFLDDSCAVLVDPTSDAEIAAGVLRALRRGDATGRVASGRRTAARYSWGRVAEGHIGHYERAQGRALAMGGRVRGLHA
jgi:glycosyltransferase-like protein